MNETIGLILTALGLAAGLIWLVIRLSTKPLEEVVKNNTATMERVFAILERHECELKEHGEDIAKLEERTSKPTRKRGA